MKKQQQARDAIVELLTRIDGATDEEIMEMLGGCNESTVRTARRQLASQGLLRMNGTRLSKRGNRCSVWSLR